jgi:hypothetical protein
MSTHVEANKPERYTGMWLVIEEEDGIRHVLPETDILPHSTETEGESRELASSDCPCKPKTVYNDTLVVIHNSFQDKRFLDETLSLV